MVKIYSKTDKIIYAKHLVKTFGSNTLACKVIEEMLEVCPDGSDKLDLKGVLNMLKDVNYLHEISDGAKVVN